ncbi:LOW QUALITY PROTEIN: solute carrier family 2, facilitated glucose transporter member 5-like [Thalassophryne amazonica]|uniref:LOW QUALITY PROTEIN: solute carrier family 2, facilitated glucose transporter member 5-like n=1 Tax=Thalassophryne amazonica TaxID=390379 RepID=UPI0014719D5C|nr:LOW QUALITY PROTEIN: solute carrier family 2, facilitated glucose transporter member 5-like [Thalassophryne amazonica]
MPQHLTLLLECPVVIALILISGIGGTFQYGFCVCSMTSPSDFIKELVNKTCVQRYNVFLEQWQVSLIWSFAVSIFCIGGLFGSLVASQLVSKCGRKQCLLFNNIFAVTGGVLMFLSQRAMSFEMIMVARLLYGINAGVSFSVHTLYVTECSPKKLRGMVSVTSSTFISIGKFSAQLLGISEIFGTEDMWPWLLGFNCFTALIQLLTLPLLPESPKHLLLDKGDRQACEKALRRLWGHMDYSMEVEEMLQEKAALQNTRSHTVMELISNKSLRWQLITVIVTFTTLQFCGISAVLFYLFEVFRAAGIREHQLCYVAMGTGLCDLLTALACFMIVGRIGKKALLFKGYMGMSTTLVLLIITLYLKDKVSWMPYCSMVLVFMYIICFSSGPGGTTVSLPGEIFTQSYKSAAFTIACMLNWIGMFLLGIIFPILVDSLGYFCFIIFRFFCTTAGLFVRLYVPEMKNLTVLQIAEEFQKLHCRSAQKLNKQQQSRIKICQTKF